MRFSAVCALSAALSVSAAQDWSSYGGDPGGMRYSPLRQINRKNVRLLRPAWTYHTGEKNTRQQPIECTPLAVDGTVYLTTAFARVAALDGATGRELWKFDPHENMAVPGYTVNRGVAYWTDGRESRILLGTADGRLFSLDARTGRPDPKFGTRGVIHLRAGITDRNLAGLSYGVTSAPAIFENIVLLGFTCGEGPEPSAPGDIRAFDVRTGKELWRFHTVPRTGEKGHETWEGDSWKNRGGVNAWSGLSIDRKRGIAFAGLGAPAFDFYGGDRPGANLFANCVLALDARTGKRLWHFQVIHHDLLDHDLPTFPNVITLRRHGHEIQAVAQITKTGFVFVFDRLTGKPVFPIEERPVASSDVPGEHSWPTQPFPLKPPPFAKQEFNEEDITDLSPESHQRVLEEFRNLRSGPVHTPGSERGTAVIPGFLGGGTWSGASFDPKTGTLYVNANNMPNLLRIIPVEGKPYPFRHNGWIQFKDPQGYPAIKPPWGTLNAIDLNHGTFRWRAVLGEFPELTAKGIPQTGAFSLGGSIVTAGGLVFIGGTRDEKFRAFDKKNGRLLWEHKLDAGGYATPATFLADGRQFVIIAAGGGGKQNTPPGDEFVAFALPRVPE